MMKSLLRQQQNFKDKESYDRRRIRDFKIRIERLTNEVKSLNVEKKKLTVDFEGKKAAHAKINKALEKAVLNLKLFADLLTYECEARKAVEKKNAELAADLEVKEKILKIFKSISK